jgi:ketosteroid isomerase-like protein
VYQFLVKRHLRRQFDRVSVGDYESVFRGIDDHVHHRFAGQHPLGGERHTKQSIRVWFQRLFRLCRSLVFEVHRIKLTGWPWDLRAAAEWSATATPACATLTALRWRGFDIRAPASSLPTEEEVLIQ